MLSPVQRSARHCSLAPDTTDDSRSERLPCSSFPGDNITVGPDGNLWFTETTGPFRIGRLTPAGALTEFTVSLPFTPNGMSITSGPDGDLWYTAIAFEHLPPWAVSLIGRMTITGSLTLVVPALPGSEIFQVTAGPDGNLWFRFPFPPRRRSLRPASWPARMGTSGSRRRAQVLLDGSPSMEPSRCIRSRTVPCARPSCYLTCPRGLTAISG